MDSTKHAKVNKPVPYKKYPQPQEECNHVWVETDYDGPNYIEYMCKLCKKVITSEMPD